MKSLIIATRGSPLALAQAELVASRCRAVFPGLAIKLSIIKTTGDKLQRASLAAKTDTLPKGLFTKELEVALLEGQADLAVHSLKDLPTELPDGLALGAVLERADPRDVLVYRSEALAAQPAIETRASRRGFPAQLEVAQLPVGAVIATSSTRRREQVLALRPDLEVIEIRGNVGTRLQKLAEKSDFDATMLAAAGLARLGYRIEPDGRLRGPANAPAPGATLTRPSGTLSRRTGEGISDSLSRRTGEGWGEGSSGLLAVCLPVEQLLPCVGQAAIGIEVRTGDAQIAAVCARLNHPETFQCVTAERTFLHALGGGCQSPVAAYAQITDGRLALRGVSFRSGPARRAEVTGPPAEAVRLGEELAVGLR